MVQTAAGSSDSEKLKERVFDIANEPGEKIYPGELAKGLEIFVGGSEIDYVGASAVELVGAGESAGNYREIAIDGGMVTTIGFR